MVAQVNGRNNSYKLKNETRQILHLCISITKSPKTFTTTYWGHYNNTKRYGGNKRTQSFDFDFDEMLVRN